MSLIKANNGSLFQFSTKDNSTNKIIQIGGSEQIYPYSFHSLVTFVSQSRIVIDNQQRNQSALDTTSTTVSSLSGPVFVNALTYNVRRLSPSSPTTHSIGNLELWSGSYDYGVSTNGGGAFECDNDNSPILFDFTSSISSTQSTNGIPAGSVLIIYDASNTTNSGITLTGSFNMGTTQSLTTTDQGASITVIRKTGGNRWIVLSQTGNWTAT